MGYIIFSIMLVLETIPIEKYNFDFGPGWILIVLIILIDMGIKTNKL